MSEEYYSDCCWAPLEASALDQHANAIARDGSLNPTMRGECSACGEHSGNLVTQVDINRKIKEFILKKRR